MCVIGLYSGSPLTPTDAAVPRDMVQSCRSVGISRAGGPAQPSALCGPCPDPPTLLQPQPPSGTSRYSTTVSYYQGSSCLFDTVNNLLFAPQVAARSLIRSAAAQQYRCVTPQGAAAWASTGATCWRPVCPPPVPAAPMIQQQGAAALLYRPDTLQYHPSITWWQTCL